ncbi:minor tail protein [Acinetobacter phage vB_AbaP_HB01]|nr:minor tail protein [Acinetobacter phage vB_AbaP_HB01]
MLKGNQVIFVYGDPSSTLATLDELKTFMGGGDVEGVTKEYVDTQLATKASTTQLAAKADKTYVDTQLATKASTASVTPKADKTYVDAELAKKIGLPATANEGDVLTFTGGKWAAVAQTGSV